MFGSKIPHRGSLPSVPAVFWAAIINPTLFVVFHANISDLNCTHPRHPRCTLCTACTARAAPSNNAHCQRREIVISHYVTDSDSNRTGRQKVVWNARAAPRHHANQCSRWIAIRQVEDWERNPSAVLVMYLYALLALLCPPLPSFLV